MTRKSFNNVGKSPFLHAFLVVARMAAAVFRIADKLRDYTAAKNILAQTKHLHPPKIRTEKLTHDPEINQLAMAGILLIPLPVIASSAIG